MKHKTRPRRSLSPIERTNIEVRGAGTRDTALLVNAPEDAERAVLTGVCKSSPINPTCWGRHTVQPGHVYTPNEPSLNATSSSCTSSLKFPEAVRGHI